MTRQTRRTIMAVLLTATAFSTPGQAATCTVSRLANGPWLARHAGSSTGQVEVMAPTRDEALTKIRNEVQYRIEWCPCSGASGDAVELQVWEEGGRP
jgi:hypothetical protein